MAYPFPRLASGPQTPQCLKGVESPRTMSRNVARRLPAIRVIMVTTVLLLMLFWSIKTFPQRNHNVDDIPFLSDSVDDYFEHFEGQQDCGIRSAHLYISPQSTPSTSPTLRDHLSYCPTRSALLKALSSGGRHGFDTPFFPKGCHYRWYTITEICMILDRFDGLVFIGDGMLSNIYKAFNILLRENQARGALQQWKIDGAQWDKCKCDNQFTTGSCSERMVMSNMEVRENDAKGGSGRHSPYKCDRMPHMFLHVSGSPAESLHASVSRLLSRDPDSYRPIPIIHSMGLSTSLSYSAATASMDEWTSLADSIPTFRTNPFLWVGPAAAGHLKPPGLIMSQGNNALWHYTIEMAKEAEARGMEVLSMYNATLQAGSWDGSGYGIKVALVQAMMVINWLARIEST